MYYPIQIPYILNEKFMKHINYRETMIPELTDFVICQWEMLPLENKSTQLENIIILDGCIDLVVDFEEQRIGFSGMSQTDLHFPIRLPRKFMGLRLMPGAFHQLTGRKAIEAMDNFLSITEVYTEFDASYFFSLSFEKAKMYLINFINQKTQGIRPSLYTQLFNELIHDPPTSVAEMSQQLNISQSQCQRNFNKNYGLTPKVVLSIIRFQKSLGILTKTEQKPSEVLASVQYYDQSHFINDFKRTIGLTPHELLARYQE
ncbi:hypothetical protein IGI37_001149 [Enterococcus sp. AZ194]|uniref:helix-turn-helix domain-containing protein n=1 Tax=Enterococcus sp. AZ194 TaxID=2774629 RepID=UPI003F2260D7